MSDQQSHLKKKRTVHKEKLFGILLQLNWSHVVSTGILNSVLSKWERWSCQLLWPNEQTPWCLCPLYIYLIIYLKQTVHGGHFPLNYNQYHFHSLDKKKESIMCFPVYYVMTILLFCLRSHTCGGVYFVAPYQAKRQPRVLLKLLKVG